MSSYRRALLVAVAVICLFFLLRTGRTPSPISQKPESFSPDLEAELNLKETPADSGNAHDPKDGYGLQEQSGSQKYVSSKKTIRQQLAYHFPYERAEKFPAYIWQTWKYTPSDERFGEEFREAEASWTMLHPSFIHEIVTDSVAIHLVRYLYSAIPEVVDAYLSLPLPILKADFFRYLILLARGGIYTDIDTYAIRSAWDWVPSEVSPEAFGLVIGVEADPDRPDWHEWYSRRIQFCQWTIQAKPGHPVLREIVAHVTEETLRRKRLGQFKKTGKVVDSIVEFTGPAIWTDKVFDYFNDERYFDITPGATNVTWKQFTGMTEPKRVGDVVILPITGFSPGVGQMGSEEPDHPSACVKHEFEGQIFDNHDIWILC